LKPSVWNSLAMAIEGSRLSCIVKGSSSTTRRSSDHESQ
jgi:hypothetical protein